MALMQNMFQNHYARESCLLQIKRINKTLHEFVFSYPALDPHLVHSVLLTLLVFFLAPHMTVRCQYERIPLMFEMSMLSCISFSHVRSMHSYTDCRISLGSSSTHLKTRTKQKTNINTKLGHEKKQVDDKCIILPLTLPWGSSV